MSQSSVSAQLARLRHMFDDALLIPAQTGRGMTPTARATALAEPLHAAPQALGEVVVGLPLIQSLESISGSQVRLAFQTPDAGRIAEQMERGDIDLLIGSQCMVPQSMKARLLLTERFVLVQRKWHPRGHQPLTTEAYCGLKHVLVSIAGGGFYGYVDVLEALHRKRTVALSVQQFTVVLEVLLSTDFVCTLPSRFAVRHAAVLDSFELPFEAEGFALFAAWHPRNQVDPAAVWLRDKVVACAGDHGSAES